MTAWCNEGAGFLFLGEYSKRLTCPATAEFSRRMPAGLFIVASSVGCTTTVCAVLRLASSGHRSILYGREMREVRGLVWLLTGRDGYVCFWWLHEPAAREGVRDAIEVQERVMRGG